MIQLSSVARAISLPFLTQQELRHDDSEAALPPRPSQVSFFSSSKSGNLSPEGGSYSSPYSNFRTAMDSSARRRSLSLIAWSSLTYLAANVRTRSSVS